MLSLIFAPAHGSTAWDCRPPSVPCFLLFPPLIPGKPRVLGGGGRSSSASARCRSYRAAPTRRGRGAGPATSTVGPPVPASSDRRPARPWRFVWRPGIAPAGCAACDQPPRAPWASGRAGPPGVAVRAGGRSRDPGHTADGGQGAARPGGLGARARMGDRRLQPRLRVGLVRRGLRHGGGEEDRCRRIDHGLAGIAWDEAALGAEGGHDSARRVGDGPLGRGHRDRPGRGPASSRASRMVRRRPSRKARSTSSSSSVRWVPYRGRPGHRLRGPGAVGRPPPPAPSGRRASPGAARPGP